MSNGEIWKDIPGFPRYRISSHGNFVNHNGVCTNYSDHQDEGSGYRIVGLRIGKQLYSRSLHSLVMLAFVGDRPRKYVINHKDLNKRNNHLDNLEYVTNSENQIHRYKSYPTLNRNMVNIHARISEDVDKSLKTQAKAEGRSKTNLIAWILTQAVKEDE